MRQFSTLLCYGAVYIPNCFELEIILSRLLQNSRFSLHIDSTPMLLLLVEDKKNVNGSALTYILSSDSTINEVQPASVIHTQQTVNCVHNSYFVRYKNLLTVAVRGRLLGPWSRHCDLEAPYFDGIGHIRVRSHQLYGQNEAEREGMERYSLIKPSKCISAYLLSYRWMEWNGDLPQCVYQMQIAAVNVGNSSRQSDFSFSCVVF